MARKAENRIFEIEELADPFFARTVSVMESIAERHPAYYLHPSKRWEYPWALEQASLVQGMKLLDAGSGASVFPLFLAGRGYRVTACDIRLPAAIGKDHHPAVDYAESSLTALPFADNGFGAVFCISVIEHLDKNAIPSAMGELCRVLRPGGRLLLTTDFYRNADAELWYKGPGRSFKVNWNFFDEPLLARFILSAPGFFIPGKVDLSVRWNAVSPQMIRFHGYPYTSVGICLQKSG